MLRDRTGWGLAENIASKQQEGEALRITVLFTATAETLHAIREAAALAFELQASIRILVIQVVPFPLPLECPRVRPEFRLRQFRALWKQEAIDTRIDVCLCRDARQCLGHAIAPHSIVVIGQTAARWPFTREWALIRGLKKNGHQVICVPPVKP